MRRVDRGSVPLPLPLTADGSAAARELNDARAHVESDNTRAFAFAVYKHDAVKAALHRLFHGKCAYCESYYHALTPVDVEHYRPKGAVEGVAGHKGYWWLAMNWDNLLPSCIDCNRRRRQEIISLENPLAPAIESAGKKDAFPVTGPRAKGEADDLAAEGALLLDPTRDDPEAHLVFHLGPKPPIALVLPCDPEDAPQRGAASIQVYGLNRLGLVQERTRLLRRLELLRLVIDEIDNIALRLSRSRAPAAINAATRLDGLVDRIVAEIAAMAEPDQPYSRLVAQWAREWRGTL
jgi:uncharacterized protein (TIGR02646 family)